MYINCNVCGTKTHKRPTDELNGRGKFCSRKCYYDFHKKKIKQFNCDNCKKTFGRENQKLTKATNTRFCSLVCYWEYRRNHMKEYPTFQAQEKCPELNENLLKIEYIDNKLKIKDIALKYKLGYTTVNMRMKKFGIKKRQSKDYTTLNCTAGWQRFLNKELKHTCEKCGWNKTVCDVHHKIPLRKGGKNERSNLILLCPNCHRLAHKNLLII